MRRIFACALLLGAFHAAAGAAPLQIAPQASTAESTSEAALAPAVETTPANLQRASVGGPDLGGGFIEFMFRGAALQPAFQPPAAGYQPQPAPPLAEREERDRASASSPVADTSHPRVDPKYDRQVVDYTGDEKPGTVIIDTPHKFLFLVGQGGKALRYGIGVGRPGFTWSGAKTITAMREWPDWRPPPDMVKRRPDLPRYMAGGPENPLGARALYLGSTLYRIHGSNEPWTIGTNVSSGCIRMRNADVIDLFNRVKVGTKVVVM